MRRLGVMSLLAALLSVGVFAGMFGAGSVQAASNQNPPRAYNNGGNSSVAAANQAIRRAIAAINRYRACVAAGKNNCSGLLQAANQAAARATQLAAAAGIAPPNFPSTGGGGTAPNLAGSVGVVHTQNGLGLPVGRTSSAAGNAGVTALPATGGAVPTSPDNSWIVLALAVVMMVGGLVSRAVSR